MHPNTRKSNCAIVLAMGLTLTACGGGGGGSWGGTRPEPPDPDPKPADFETSEYHAGGGLAMINASSMYARGGTGEGETVAVVDSGASPDHPDLADAYTGVECHSPEPDRPGCGLDGSPAGHGTHVAGIVGARRNGAGVHGVAFDANIVSYEYLLTHGAARDTTSLFADIRSKGIKIVNNSWGEQTCLGWGLLFGQPEACTYDTVLGLLTGNELEANVDTVLGALEVVLNDELGGFVLDDGGIMVWAVGNSGRFTTSLAINAALPSVIERFADALDQLGDNQTAAEMRAVAAKGILGWLAVVSVGSDGRETLYTQRCEVARDYCLAAPGGDDQNYPAGIKSTLPGNQYGELSGTSMAAPHVAGGLAALKSMFPNLSYQDVRNRMLCTANDTGVYSPEAGAPTSAVAGCTGKQVGTIYGHGLLDLDAASRPVGGTSFALAATDDGPVVTTDGAQIALPQAVVSHALAGQSIIVLDNFQRAPFEVPLDAFARSRDAYLSLADLALDPAHETRTETAPGRHSLSMTGDGYDASGFTDGAWFVGGGTGSAVTEGLTKLTGAAGVHGHYEMAPESLGIAVGFDAGGGDIYATAAASTPDASATGATGFGVSSWAPSSVIGATWVPQGASGGIGVSFASGLTRAAGFVGTGAFSIGAESVDVGFGHRLVDREGLGIDLSGRLAHLTPGRSAMVELDDAVVASAKVDLTAELGPEWTLSTGLGVQRGLGTARATLRIADSIDETGRIGYGEVGIEQRDMVRFDTAELTLHRAVAAGARYAAGVKAVRDGFGEMDAIVGVRAAFEW